jgi:hypothetical protein
LVELYSRGDYATLPENDDDLENLFTADEYTKVVSDNDIYVEQVATDEYSIFQFKVKNDNDTDAISPYWQGQSDIAPSSSKVVLQIYDRNGSVWEDIQEENLEDADTDFELQGTISSNLDHYYDEQYWISCRVYQLAQ